LSRPDERGVSRSSRFAGRDAVDAAAFGARHRRQGGLLHGEGSRELSSSCRRRRCAVRTGVEIHPIGIAFARRPKSCGPDARRWHQGDASSCASTEAPMSASTDGNEPKRMNRRRGEHEASRKPTACGTPDVSGAFVVANSCAFYTLRMRLRTHPASGVPRALFVRRAKRFPQNSGAPRREIAKPYPA